MKTTGFQINPSQFRLDIDCPCRESIWKRFIEYVLIEGLSAKTETTYLANFPMRAALTKFGHSLFWG